MFAVHPVHVEAVANVVGQSELWAACGAVAAVTLYIQWRRSAIRTMFGSTPTDVAVAEGPYRKRARTDSWATSAVGGPWRGAVITALVIAACLAKEHAVVTPGLLLAAELLVVNDPRPWSVRLRALRPYAFVLVAAILAYVVVRARVVGAFTGDRPNVVFEHLTPSARRWTMLGVAGDWVRLLTWPSRLAIEYAPQQIALYDHFTVELAPTAALLAALGALTVLSVRRWPVGAFALIWLAVTLLLVSNLLLPTGVILAERTLFLPSVGIVLLAGATLDRATAALHAAQIHLPRGILSRAASLGGGAVVAAVICAAAWQSARRQLVWRTTPAFSHRPWRTRRTAIGRTMSTPVSSSARRPGGRESGKPTSHSRFTRMMRCCIAISRTSTCAPDCVQAAIPLLRRSIAETTGCRLTRGSCWPSACCRKMTRTAREQKCCGGAAERGTIMAPNTTRCCWPWTARWRAGDWGRRTAMAEQTRSGMEAATP